MYAHICVCVCALQLVPSVSQRAWALILSLPLLLLVQVRELKRLTFAAGLGLGAVVFSMGAILCISVDRVAQHGPANGIEPGTSLRAVPSFFGVFLYSMDYAVAVGPVITTMHEQRTAVTVVIGVSVFSGLAYFAVGLMGLLAFGAQTKDPLSENLKKEGLSTGLVIFLALSVLLTLPIALFPVAQIIDNKFRNFNPVLVRCAVVMVPVLGSLCLSSMTDAMDLVTGLLGVVLNIVLPCCMYYRHFSADLDVASKASIAFLLVIGSMFGIACFFTALVKMMHSSGISIDLS